MTDDARRWYAVWTRANHEVVATDRMHAAGIEAYLPTLKVPSRRQDRRVEITRPLFPGYLFVHATLERAERLEIIKAPGVVQILGSAGGAPQPVPDWQVTSIQSLLSTTRPVEILYHLVPGKRVRIQRGPLAGVEGVVIGQRGRGKQLVVSVDIMGRSVAVELAAEDLRPA